MLESRICEICIDCEDTICAGKQCHKENRCEITDDCFTQCEEGIGGFIGKIPILDLK